MNWADERYVRIYTRDTADVLSVGWQGRFVLWELLRKADRAGVIDHGGDMGVVADMLRVPVEIFDIGLERLKLRGTIRVTDRYIVIPNYLAAQEAIQSDAQRQRESRARRYERALADGIDPTSAKAVARPDLYGYSVAKRDPLRSQGDPVCDRNGQSGHVRSRPVTRGHSVPSRTVPSRTEISGTSTPVGSGELEFAEGTEIQEIPAGDRPKGIEARHALVAALGYLNKLSGHNFESTEGRVTAVKRILGEGRRLEDIRAVFWSKCKGPRKWLGDERMDQHLNPDTLLRKANFQKYLEQAREELAKEMPERARELGYVGPNGTGS